MKLLISALFASMAALVRSQDLEARWKFSNPTITYDENYNQFTLKFEDASSQNDQMETVFYDFDCASVPPDTPNDPIGPPVIHNGVQGDATLAMDAVEEYPVLTFQVDTKEAVKMQSIYTFVDDDLITSLADQGSTDFTADDIGYGFVRICARNGIGYLDATTGLYKEVNFIETQITIKYDLEADFEVTAFGVKPKERQQRDEDTKDYNLNAYLCDASFQSYTPGDFNQGDVITVCIEPDAIALADGIGIKSINNFKWTRDDPVSIFQDAIKEGDLATNGLSNYSNTNILWVISSILFAEFYVSQGLVEGDGDATLFFIESDSGPPDADGRRLGEVEDADLAARRRKLQEDPVTAFDVSVGVGVGDDGPGALKTAGGASFGVTAMASTVALLSAALLA